MFGEAKTIAIFTLFWSVHSGLYRMVYLVTVSVGFRHHLATFWTNHGAVPRDTQGTTPPEMHFRADFLQQTQAR